MEKKWEQELDVLRVEGRDGVKTGGVRSIAATKFCLCLLVVTVLIFGIHIVWDK